MKRLCTIVMAVMLSATPLVAQDAAVPQMDVTMITQDSVDSSGGIIVPLFALILVALAVSGGNGDY